MIGRIISAFIAILIGTTLLSDFYKDLNLISWTIDDVPHRQTYQEYVQERLNVERMMR